MTVGELKTCLEAFDDDWSVDVAPDMEVTAAIGKGVIFADSGLIVIERAKDE